MKIKIEKPIVLTQEEDGFYVEIPESMFGVCICQRKKMGRPKGYHPKKHLMAKAIETTVKKQESEEKMFSGRTQNKIYDEIKDRKRFLAGDIISKVGGNYKVIDKVALKLGFEKVRIGHKLKYIKQE